MEAVSAEQEHAPLLDNIKALVEKEREVARLQLEEKEREIEALRAQVGVLRTTPSASPPTDVSDSAPSLRLQSTRSELLPVFATTTAPRSTLLPRVEESAPAAADGPLGPLATDEVQSPQAILDSPALQSLTMINFAGQPLAASAIARLARQLRWLPSVRIVVLRSTGMTDECAQSVVSLADDALRLQRLDVSINELGPQFAHLLPITLRANRSLQVLNLAHNPLSQDPQFGHNLGEALRRHPALHTLGATLAVPARAARATEGARHGAAAREAAKHDYPSGTTRGRQARANDTALSAVLEQTAVQSLALVGTRMSPRAVLMLAYHAHSLTALDLTSALLALDGARVLARLLGADCGPLPASAASSKTAVGQRARTSAAEAGTTRRRAATPNRRDRATLLPAPPAAAALPPAAETWRPMPPCQLVWLCLRMNGLSNAAAAVLAHGLRVNRSLTWVDLSANDIADDGALALAAALEHNGTLAGLRVTENAMGEAGVTALCRAASAPRSALLRVQLEPLVAVTRCAALASALRCRAAEAEARRPQLPLAARRGAVGGASEASWERVCRDEYVVASPVTPAAHAADEAAAAAAATAAALAAPSLEAPTRTLPEVAAFAALASVRACMPHHAAYVPAAGLLRCTWRARRLRVRACCPFFALDRSPATPDAGRAGARPALAEQGGLVAVPHPGAHWAPQDGARAAAEQVPPMVLHPELADGLPQAGPGSWYLAQPGARTGGGVSVLPFLWRITRNGATAAAGSDAWAVPQPGASLAGACDSCDGATPWLHFSVELAGCEQGDSVRLWVGGADSRRYEVVETRDFTLWCARAESEAGPGRAGAGRATIELWGDDPFSATPVHT